MELGYMLALFVALLTGISSLFTKKTLVSLHAAQFMAGKATIDFVMLIALAPFLARWPGWEAMGYIALVACIAPVASLLITKSIRHKSMGEVFPLFNISPAILVVFAVVFLGETISKMQFLGIGAIMIGAYFLQAEKHDLLKPFKSLKSKYVIFVIIAMIIYSATATMEKSFLGSLIDPLVYLWWIRLFLSVIYFSLDSVMYSSKEIVGVVKGNWKELGALAGIGWVALGLMYFAIPLLNISILIPIKRSSTLFATILGGKLFHEGHYVQRIGACAIMLAGVIILVL